MHAARGIAWLLVACCVVACSKKTRPAEDLASQPVPKMALAATPALPPSVSAPPANSPIRAYHAPLQSNPWQIAHDAPLSTFSIDVDTGSYALVRRMLREGQRPPANAVRTEEFLNYFNHGYRAPAQLDPPFTVSAELAPSPWTADRHLLQIGLQGYEVDAQDLPPANLVFLIDTSGSMHSADKLGLLRTGLRSLVQQLRAQDRVAIVAYAGSAGLVLPSTSGDRQGAILAALDDLQAGGSTNGGAGIALAYKVAAETHVKNGINRVILATDGDFNVGMTSIDALKALVTEHRASGTGLTTLGFGTAGFNDEIAEQLANVGNGHYAYIDDELEARKVLVAQMGGTLLTIASDVKVQLAFDPQQVARYRLVGYENRRLANADFSNDRIDAGEIGAGHSVTALYELELQPSADPRAQVAELRLRYKRPGEEGSRLISHTLRQQDIRPAPSERLSFAAVVAGFAEKLRGNPELAALPFAELIALLDRAADSASDPERAELRDLIELSDALPAAVSLN